MKRLWMFLAMSFLALAIASVPSVWAQEMQVFQVNGETITVTQILPDSIVNKIGVGDIVTKGDSIFAATTSYLWFSPDSGKTWIQRNASNGLNVSIGWVKSVALIDSGCLLASGGNGIFRSTNQGETWNHIFWAPPYGRIATFLVATDKTIFAACDRIFRSTDNGNTWQQVADSALTWPYIWCMTQTAYGTILAGISSSGPTAGRGVLRSIDNGNTWVLQDSGFSAHKNIMGLASYSNGSSHTVFAATYDNGVYESTDDGLSWQKNSIPRIFGWAAEACPPLGVFIGFGEYRIDPLYRLKDSEWVTVPGLFGYAVYSVAKFSENTIVVGGSGAMWLISFEGSTDVTDNPQEVPKSFTLFQNYPNPFNPTTSIEYQVSRMTYVTLKIYDALGREVATLVDGMQYPGTYRTEWNGSKYPSGTYFYRLETKSFTQTKKMLLVK